MEKEIKDLLLDIQCEIKNINKKLDRVEETAANGNFASTDHGESISKEIR